MVEQRPARQSFPAAPAVCDPTGTVVSIDHARRRRRRRRGPSAPGGAIRVLVVGSRALTRAGLRRLLEDDRGIVVIGEAADGDEAIRQVRSIEPDVVLLDACCRQLDPAEVTRALRGHVAVLLVTDTEGGDRLLGALRAGATGVLPADSHPAHLASAVRTVASGGASLPPSTARRLIAELVEQHITPR
jgi:DNA-binding NarL/FixJ family response regulator